MHTATRANVNIFFFFSSSRQKAGGRFVVEESEPSPPKLSLLYIIPHRSRNVAFESWDSLIPGIVLATGDST